MLVFSLMLFKRDIGNVACLIITSIDLYTCIGLDDIVKVTEVFTNNSESRSFQF